MRSVTDWIAMGCREAGEWIRMIQEDALESAADVCMDYSERCVEKIEEMIEKLKPHDSERGGDG